MGWSLERRGVGSGSVMGAGERELGFGNGVWDWDWAFGNGYGNGIRNGHWESGRIASDKSVLISSLIHVMQMA